MRNRNYYREDILKMNRRHMMCNFIAVFIKYMGIAIIVVGILLLVSVPGHADMMIDMGQIDDWSIVDYLLHTALSVVVSGFGYIVYYIGNFILNN